MNTFIALVIAFLVSTTNMNNWQCQPAIHNNTREIACYETTTDAAARAHYTGYATLTIEYSAPGQSGWAILGTVGY